MGLGRSQTNPITGVGRSHGLAETLELGRWVGEIRMLQGLREEGDRSRRVEFAH
jgi:hypothetical protein